MNNNRILFLTNPAYPHEAVSKNYVDRKFDTLSFLSYEGHIPSLERALSKTGFIVNTSSRLDAFHQGWAAFNNGRHGEWVTAGEGKDAWIQISCPTPVRIWKIRLTGFIVNTSSRLDAFHQGWAAFNKGRHGEWVTAGEGKDAWIQFSCPTPVRIWKIRLTGRRSNRERITSWKLCGVTGETFTDIYTSDTTLGSTMQEFLVSPAEATAPID